MRAARAAATQARECGLAARLVARDQYDSRTHARESPRGNLAYSRRRPRDDHYLALHDPPPCVAGRTIAIGDEPPGYVLPAQGDQRLAPWGCNATMGWLAILNWAWCHASLPEVLCAFLTASKSPSRVY